MVLDRITSRGFRISISLSTTITVFTKGLRLRRATIAEARMGRGDMAIEAMPCPQRVAVASTTEISGHEGLPPIYPFGNCFGPVLRRGGLVFSPHIKKYLTIKDNEIPWVCDLREFEWCRAYLLSDLHASEP
jgi:hypothetical protein